MVARSHARHALPDRLDDTRPLVPEHRGTRRLGRAVDCVQIGVADAAGTKPDEHLVRLRRRELELLHGESAMRLFEHCAANSHYRRPGAKGLSSGAARPSRTSGASSAAVAGASVTPSIPWPVATKSPS